VCVCANNAVHEALFSSWVLADTSGAVSQYVGCIQIGKIQFHRCNYFAPVTQSAPSARAVGSFYAIFNTLTVSVAAQPSRSHAKTCVRGY